MCVSDSFDGGSGCIRDSPLPPLHLSAQQGGYPRASISCTRTHLQSLQSTGVLLVGASAPGRATPAAAMLAFPQGRALRERFRESLFAAAPASPRTDAAATTAAASSSSLGAHKTAKGLHAVPASSRASEDAAPSLRAAAAKERAWAALERAVAVVTMFLVFGGTYVVLPCAWMPLLYFALQVRLARRAARAGAPADAGCHPRGLRCDVLRNPRLPSHGG